MIASVIVDAISKISPVLGAALGGPLGGIVGALISSTLGGVSMDDTGKVLNALQNNPEVPQKLKELELQLTDLQNARNTASKEQGGLRLVRPLLAIVAMLAIVADIVAIQYTTNTMLSQILITMLVVLVWDVRQIYKFYFGSSDDLPNMGFMGKKK
jgi:hypothetical protein